MKVKLMKREHHGIATPLKELNIDGKLEDYYKGENKIQEDLLLQHIPNDFLPTKPENVLVYVESVQNEVGFIQPPKGQKGLKVFLSWHKDHDTYMILLCRESV